MLPWMKPLLASLFLLTLIAACSGGERKAYFLNTNWVPQLKQDGTNVTTNMVGVITPEEAPLAVPVAPQAAKAVKADDPGSGLVGIITTLIAALLGAFFKWQQLRQKKLNTVMGQGYEVSREIVKSSAGAATEAKMVEQMKSDQVDAGVKGMGFDLSSNRVNTYDAKRTADAILAS